MKNYLILCFFVFNSIIIIAQKNDNFIFKGNARLVATWNYSLHSDKTIVGKLSNGDKIQMWYSYGAVKCIVIRDKNSENLGQFDEQFTNEDNDISNQYLLLKAYEYDFNKDGVNEIIVVANYSSDDSMDNTYISVFRYSNGLSSEVKTFFFPNAALMVILDKDEMWVKPVMRSCCTGIYTYKNGQFYTLQEF